MSSHYADGTAYDPSAPWNDDLDPDELEDARIDALMDRADEYRKERGW